MKHTVIKIFKIVLTYWKPDFRKTTGWLCMSTGLALLAPPFIQELILTALNIADIFPTTFLSSTSLTGSLLFNAGVLYHLLYLDEVKNNSEHNNLLTAMLLTMLTLLVVANL